MSAAVSAAGTAATAVAAGTAAVIYIDGICIVEILYNDVFL